MNQLEAADKKARSLEGQGIFVQCVVCVFARNGSTEICQDMYCEKSFVLAVEVLKEKVAALESAASVTVPPPPPPGGMFGIKGCGEGRRRMLEIVS